MFFFLRVIMEKINIENEKVIFAVSFLAVLVTLNNYKEYLTMRIVIFSYSFSIYNVLIYMSVILFFSVYISALAKLKENKLWLPQLKCLNKCLNKCDDVADIFYSIAITLPFYFLLFYVFSCLYYGVIYILSIFARFNFLPSPAIYIIDKIVTFSSLLLSVILLVVIFLIVLQTIKILYGLIDSVFTFAPHIILWTVGVIILIAIIYLGMVHSGALTIGS